MTFLHRICISLPHLVLIFERKSLKILLIMNWKYKYKLLKIFFNKKDIEASKTLFIKHWVVERRILMISDLNYLLFMYLIRIILSI